MYYFKELFSSMNPFSKKIDVHKASTEQLRNVIQRSTELNGKKPTSMKDIWRGIHSILKDNIGDIFNDTEVGIGYANDIFNRGICGINSHLGSCVIEVGLPIKERTHTHMSSLDLNRANAVINSLPSSMCRGFVGEIVIYLNKNELKIYKKNKKKFKRTLNDCGVFFTTHPVIRKIRVTRSGEPINGFVFVLEFQYYMFMEDFNIEDSTIESNYFKKFERNRVEYEKNEMIEILKRSTESRGATVTSLKRKLKRKSHRYSYEAFSSARLSDARNH